MLYRFKGGQDGAYPEGSLIMDTSGALFGTTEEGGTGCSGIPPGCGTVFKLTPPGAGETEWTESVLHRFQGGADGESPFAGLTMDMSGALYGTTGSGGTGCPPVGCGTVFQRNGAPKRAAHAGSEEQ